MTITKPEVNPDGLYSVKDAAAALQINRSTLDKYIRDGLVKCKIRKIGNRKVISGAEIVKCWRAVYL